MVRFACRAFCCACHACAWRLVQLTLHAPLFRHHGHQTQRKEKRLLCSAVLGRECAHPAKATRAQLRSQRWDLQSEECSGPTSISSRQPCISATPANTSLLNASSVRFAVVGRFPISSYRDEGRVRQRFTRVTAPAQKVFASPVGRNPIASSHTPHAPCQVFVLFCKCVCTGQNFCRWWMP